MRITKFQRKVKIAKWELKTDVSVCDCYGIHSNLTAVHAFVIGEQFVKKQLLIYNPKKRVLKLDTLDIPF